MKCYNNTRRSTGAVPERVHTITVISALGKKPLVQLLCVKDRTVHVYVREIGMPARWHRGRRLFMAMHPSAMPFPLSMYVQKKRNWAPARSFTSYSAVRTNCIRCTSKKPVSTTICHKLLMAYNSGSFTFCDVRCWCRV